jgi:hypothetical protein
MSFKIQLLETFPQKQKEQGQKQLDADKLVTTQIGMLKNLMSHVFSRFPFLYIMNSLQNLLDLKNVSERKLHI